MDEYVSRVVLDVDGKQIDDFNSVTEHEVEVRKAVNLARKTGFVQATPRYGVSVDYVVPKDRGEFDFEGIENGRLTLDFENGRRTTYTGVTTLKIGEAKYGDGDSPATRTIELGASGRVKE